jgi:hypothetical protein
MINLSTRKKRMHLKCVLGGDGSTAISSRTILYTSFLHPYTKLASNGYFMVPGVCLFRKRLS